MSDKTGRERIRPPRRVATARAQRSADAAVAEAPAHPGVLAAHAGPVDPADCAHPAARRDIKNPARCCACGAVGLDPPPARARR